MDNKNANEYLDYYLDSQHHAQSAVLLEGPWGSGKTHFIKTYLHRREDSVLGASAESGSSFLYASLYGVREVSQIRDQFFAQAHPLLNQKAVRIVGTVLSRALNVFAGVDTNDAGENKEILQNLVMKLGGRVLVFDDLERSAMPLGEVMGFINAFVEHDGMKVIVIASEADIPEAQTTEYRRKKEKLIGKTLKVGSDPSDVLDEICSSLSLKSVLDTITRTRTRLLRTFVASDILNYRSLRAIIQDFERLVTLVNSRLAKSEQAMSQLLLFMISTGLEFRAGKIREEEFKLLRNPTSWKVRRHLSKDSVSQAVENADRLERQYSDVDWDNPVVPPLEILSLFATGTIDIPCVDEYVQQHSLVADADNIPAWRQLWNWHDLSATAFTNSSKKLKEQLQSGSLTHPGEILHAAGILLSIRRFGHYLLTPRTNVVRYFDRYIRGLVRQRKLIPAREVFSFGGGFGLGYQEEESEEFKRIREKLHSSTLIVFSFQMKDEAEKLLQRLRVDSDAWSALVEHGVHEGNFADAEILHHISPSDFADIMIVDSKLNGSLFAALLQRYSMELHNQQLVAEYKWVRQLRRELQKRVNKARAPHKAMLESRISYYFDKIEKATTVAFAVA